MANTVNCPVCGKLTDSRLDSCPHCGAYLKRIGTQPAAPQVKKQKNCPQCQALVDEGDIICMACGTNLLTGQKIVEEAAQRKGMPIQLLIAGMIAAILVIVVGIFWLYTATRNPYNTAMRLIQEREYLEAQTLLSEYVEEVPEDARALYELGRLQWRANQFDNAADSFSRAVEVDPRDANTALWAAVALSRGTASDSRRRQVTLLERATNVRRDDPALWYLLALARGTTGDREGQVEALKEVIRIRPTDESVRWSMGVSRALDGELAEAQSELEMVREGPHRADALAALGFVAGLDRSRQRAIQYLEQALGAGGLSVSAQARTELGRLYMVDGDYQTAQQHFEQALAERPSDLLVQYLRSVCLEARGRRQDALEAYESITRERGAYAMEANVQAARIYLSMNMPDRARQAVDQAQRLGATSAAYMTTRGRVLVMEENDASALDAFRQAINTDPRFSGAYLERGLLHVRNDNLAGGLKDLEAYLELVGTNTLGTKAADIRALTNQLRQASQDAQGQQTARRASGPGGASL